MGKLLPLVGCRHLPSGREATLPSRYLRLFVSLEDYPLEDCRGQHARAAGLAPPWERPPPVDIAPPSPIGCGRLREMRAPASTPGTRACLGSSSPPSVTISSRPCRPTTSRGWPVPCSP